MATKIVKTTKKVKSEETPVTMEELLASTGGSVRGFKRGQTIEGKVVEVANHTVYIDVGGKAEAMVSEQEFSLAKDYFRSLKPGDAVTGYVLVSENDSGQVILSLRRAVTEGKWKTFEQALAEDDILTVKGKEITRGGMLVDVEGVYGFIPTSQFGEVMAKEASSYIGKSIKVRVVEVDRTQNRLVLSEKQVADAQEIEERRKALAAVKVGGEYSGTVVGIVPFGVFVQINSDTKDVLEGLVHISEISWEKIDDVGKTLKEGTKVKVQVIGVDEETGKLALSIKRLGTDPWLSMAIKYPVDSKHSGVVTKIVPYGVLVRLAPGIEGLIHASKMPSDKAFKDGDEVEIFVESVDLDKRRLSLGVISKETKGMIYK